MAGWLPKIVGLALCVAALTAASLCASPANEDDRIRIDTYRMQRHDPSHKDYATRTRELLDAAPHEDAHPSALRAAATAAHPSARCASECSGRGTCLVERTSSGTSARCLCQPGYTGTACETRDPSPCNTPEGGRVLSRCAGHCDEDVNRCMCGAGSAFANRSMRGCAYEGVERDMPWMSPKWGGVTLRPAGHFWASRGGGSHSWCDAKPREHTRARCECYDGEDAASHCAPPEAPSTASHFCLNRCSGRGECRSGFCACFAGSSGADCSIVAAARGDAATPNRGEALVALPRIYVYELPGDFNTFLLARRLDHRACALRSYQKKAVRWSDTLYGAEVALHEALLASAHRTRDPEEADFFYVPLYTGCFVSEFNRPYPRHWLCDECHRGKPADLASLRAERWQREALRFIRSAYPYWDRSRGTDHLWPATHDEGACYSPDEAGRAIMLTHWGRQALRPNGSSEYHLWRVKPHAERMYGWTRCFDPCKDIVIPSWREPDYYGGSKGYLAAKSRPRRTTLFYFNGNLGGSHQMENYSFGLRQQLDSLYGHLAARGEVVVTSKKTPLYHEQLSNSKFCGVLPGWGWSGRFEDAVLHGCIPVVIQDGVSTPWEGVLDWQAYSLRLPRAELGSLLDRLRAVPQGRVKEMQQALDRVWRRFTYHSVVAAEEDALGGWQGAASTGGARGATSMDAVSTLIDELRARLVAKRQRGSPRPSTDTMCVRDGFGGWVSPPPAANVGVMQGYEERRINGWTI